MRQLLVVGVAGLALLGTAGPAFAAESAPNGHWVPDTVSSGNGKQAKVAGGEELPPTVDAKAGCGPLDTKEAAKGFVEVAVTNPNKPDTDATPAVNSTTDADITYKVSLLKAGSEVKTGTVKVGSDKTESVLFEDVPGGAYRVRVASDKATTNVDGDLHVDRCSEIKTPVTGALQVSVRCDGSQGLVTIRVFNLDRKEKEFTVTIDGEPFADPVAIEAGDFVFSDDLEAPDGTYQVRVKADGVDTSEAVKVACVPTPPVNNPTEPAPQGRPANTGLADTGASVVWLTVAGVAVLGLGGGLVLFGRRRRARVSR